MKFWIVVMEVALFVLTGCGALRTPEQQTAHDDAPYREASSPYTRDLNPGMYNSTPTEPRPAESVQAELVRLQQQTGLSLASFGWGLDIVLFDKRTLVQIP